MHAVPARLSRPARSAALPLCWRTCRGSYARVACYHWHTRSLSTEAPAAKGDAGANAGGDEKPQEILIYQGGRAKPLRILKTASFINCTASLIGSPVIVTADIAMPFAARLGMATTMAFFGLSTTGTHCCQNLWWHLNSSIVRGDLTMPSLSYGRLFGVGV